jgi:hypothetical protein
MDSKKTFLFKILIWISGYLGYIPFILVGGFSYFYLKDEELQGTTKKTLWVVLSFLCLEVIMSIVSSIVSMANGNFMALQNIESIINIVRIVIFIAFACLDLFSKSNKKMNKDDEEDNLDLDDLK